MNIQLIFLSRLMCYIRYYAIFQFKIIHHILPTISTLFRDSITKHDKCHLCSEWQTSTHLFLLPVLPVLKLVFFGLFLLNWWSSKNGDRITVDKNEIIQGVTDDFARHLGLNLRMIIANYYSYSASRKKEEFLFRCFRSDVDKQN